MLRYSGCQAARLSVGFLGSRVFRSLSCVLRMCNFSADEQEGDVDVALMGHASAESAWDERSTRSLALLAEGTSRIHNCTSSQGGFTIHNSDSGYNRLDRSA